MKTISIINRKGGTGKTATAHALGSRLAQVGSKVLFIDLDDQCNLSNNCGINQEPELTAYEVLMGECDINEAIISSGNVDILPASTSLALINAVMLDKDEAGKDVIIRLPANLLKEAIAKLDKKYDFIIIDSPATLGARSMFALTASNGVIIPLEAEPASLQGVAILNDLIENVRASYNSDLKIYGLLLTRYSQRNILTRDLTETAQECADVLRAPLFNTRIRECVSIKEARLVQQDIFTYAPKSNASADYNNFIIELLREV